MDTQDFNKMDSFIALSFINTKLRDEYNSLENLCSSLNLNKEQVIAKFETIDYKYDRSHNQFK